MNKPLWTLELYVKFSVMTVELLRNMYNLILFIYPLGRWQKMSQQKVVFPLLVFNIMMSGQFCTLALFYVWFVSIIQVYVYQPFNVCVLSEQATEGDDQTKKKEEVLGQMFPIYIWPLDELLWTMHTMLPWGFPNMKTSSQYLEQPSIICTMCKTTYF